MIGFPLTRKTRYNSIMLVRAIGLAKFSAYILRT